MNTQSIIVPQISSFPAHEAKARAILRWLVKLDVVEESLTTGIVTMAGVVLDLLKPAK